MTWHRIFSIHSHPYIFVQIDESTDVSGCAQLVAFVRFQADERIVEEILFCNALPTNTTGECLYNLFQESTCGFEIDWKKCIRIRSDRTKTTTGCKSSFVVRLKDVMPNAKWNHCFLHRNSLAAKFLLANYKVLYEVIKVVN